MQKRIFHETEWFAFNTFELETMRNALIPLLPRYAKKIERMKNHPDNEGQADFLEKIKQLTEEHKDILKLVQEFRV